MSIGLMNEAIFARMLILGIRMINNGLRPVSFEGPEAEQRETYRTLAAFAAEHGAKGNCLEIGAGLGDGLTLIQAAGEWRVSGLDGSRIAALAARRRGTICALQISLVCRSRIIVSTIFLVSNAWSAWTTLRLD